MKKITGTVLSMLFVASVFAQTDFSGNAAVTINADIPESDGYSSLLNPGNMMGITDISMTPSMTLKLDSGDDTTAFSAWFSLKEYPLGQGLLTAEGGSLYYFDLLRLRANVYLTDSISLEVGRQSMLTGYGYGWNPIDFADPLKDPMNPDADMKGVDGVVLKTYMGSTVSLDFYALLPRNFLYSGLGFQDIKPGGELTVSLPGVEFKIAGLGDFSSIAVDNSYTTAAGAAVNLDLAGIGVYGEASARKGSRNYFADETAGQPGKKTSWLFSFLAGIEYTFASEGNLVVEYFYNGEGYDKEERLDYKSTIKVVTVPTAQLLKMYVPGYFARQYVLFNFEQPFYDVNTDISASVLYSPDSGALMVIPSLTYTFSGSLEVTAGYTGMFDLGTDDFNEVTASPVHHMVKAVFTYSF